MSIRARLKLVVVMMSMAALVAVATVGYIGVKATADTHDVLSRALLAQRSAGIAAQRLSETEQIAKTVLAMTRLRDPSEYLPAYDDAANDVQRAMTAIRDARLSEDIAEEAGKSLLALNKWVSATRIAISGETATSLPTTDVLNRWRADVSTRVAALADQVNGAAETIASQVDSRSRWEIVMAATALTVVLVVAALLGLFVADRITAAITRLIAAMQRLADNDFTVELPRVGRSDEIGGMIRAVTVFRDNAIERARLETAQREETKARLARETRLRELIADFDGRISEVVRGIDEAAGQMSQTAGTLSDIASDARGRTSSAATATDDASANMQTVAGAAEELTASVVEIGKQVTRATEVVTDAASRADRTNSEVSELAQAAQRIGEVVTLIQDIAAQTNLLALNATIEAARAGDAGRGFAVVASEVKALSTQTARATEEISQHITQVQDSTGSAVSAINEIAGVMTEVNSITGAIAAAIDEQSSATWDMSRNINDAANGTADIALNVGDISGAIDETARSAGHVNMASQELGKQAADLRERVSEFLKAVAAA